MADVKPIRLITFNLGYNVIANQIKGSESLQVANCQEVHNGGWFDNLQTISTCTHNASKLLSEYDILCLQEVHSDYANKLKQSISEHRKDAKFVFFDAKYHSKCLVTIGYNQNRTGYGFHVYSGLIPVTSSGDQRGVIAVYFPNISLLVINLHAPHHIPLVEELEKVLSQIQVQMRYIVPERIILAGDFNDCKGELLKTKIPFFNKYLGVPESKRLLSCCTDVGHRCPGDYILDTQDTGYYGFPPNYVQGAPLMSDHDPVTRNLN